MEKPTNTLEAAVEPESASGTRIECIELSEAARFLDHLTEALPVDTQLVWGAREEDGALIGVAALAVGVHRGDAVVAVVPTRRRAKVGGDLLHVLIDQARRRDLRYLACSRPDASAVPAAFLQSLGLVVARRTAAGSHRIVALVPATPTVGHRSLPA